MAYKNPHITGQYNTPRTGEPPEDLFQIQIMGKKLRSRGLNCPLNVLCIVFTLEKYRKYARFLKHRSTKFGICQIRFRSTSWTSQIHRAAKVISKRVTPLVHRAWKCRSYRNVTATICWEPVFLAVWNVGTLKSPNLLQFAKDTCDDFGKQTTIWWTQDRKDW